MDKKNTIELSVILPVLNEAKNLEFLIPQISKKLTEMNFDEFEILVIDDNSTDNTKEIVEKYEDFQNKACYILRKDFRSLPLSILQGIKKAKFENIMWLDADGSMDIDSISKLLQHFKNQRDTVYIGSRFVEGGGYKGKDLTDSKFVDIFLKIFRSEDSLIAIYFSVFFNKLISKILNYKIYDLTSGFIVGKKKYFNHSSFTNSVYGEYFIYLIDDLVKNKIILKEVGYVCQPRKFGESKTSTNLLKLFSLTKPYLLAVFKIKIK